MRFYNTKVMNFDGAFRGMRNPMNSWALSDSDFSDTERPVIGEKDMELAQKLIKGGSEHRKFLRQIFVCTDITAPLFWWKEFDTYATGVTKNSTSTMHKLAYDKIDELSFEVNFHELSQLPLHDGKSNTMEWYMNNILDFLNLLQRAYKETGDKRYWKALVCWLPESWLQTRTVTMNYENLANICRQRKGHKLSEWADFRDWAKGLPYANELIFAGEADAP